MRALRLMEWKPDPVLIEVDDPVPGFEEGRPVGIVHGHWGCGACQRCRVGMENYCEHPGGAPVAGGRGFAAHRGPPDKTPSRRLANVAATGRPLLRRFVGLGGR